MSSRLCCISCVLFSMNLNALEHAPALTCTSDSEPSGPIEYCMATRRQPHEHDRTLGARPSMESTLWYSIQHG